jgi:DNA-directed RNA polymerase specialized sigma24 family protein
MTGDEELSRELWVRSCNELWQQRATLTRNGKAVTAVFSLATRLCAKVSSPAPRRPPKGDPASLESRSAGLRHALLGIPVRPRAALCLCYFDNVGFSEAERCLGAAPGEARQLCAEGYAALTRALGPAFLNNGLA